MDSLTGLRDRAGILASLDAELQQHSDNSILAVLIINIRRFRSINAMHGYHVADMVLSETARRIQSVMRKQDITGRIGADEFAVILPGLKSPYFGELAANKVTTSLNEPLNIDGTSYNIRHNVGIAIASADHPHAEALVQDADAAMRNSRKTRQQYCVAAPAAPERLADHKVFDYELEEAISRNELQLYYQPKVNLSTQTLSGVEALVRWNHPEKGMINPDEFIHIAEKSSLILPLTLWTLNTALRQSAAICNQHRNFLVAVNMSASILDKDIVDLVMGAVQTWDVPAHQLVLEVTENAIMEKPVTCLQTLKQLRSHNIILSIDDFGTGYSSFSYLKRLPVQELKIDQSFVKDMIRNANDAHIVQAMLDLGRTFGLKVIAEGIEDWDTLDRLTNMGCDHGQGYYIARPMPFDELLEWIDHSGWTGADNPATGSYPKHQAL